MIRFVFAVLASLPIASNAQVHRCLDQQGGVTFQQSPCRATQESAREIKADIDRDKAARRVESEQNRKSVAAQLEAQLEQQIDRRANLQQRKPPEAAEPEVKSNSQPMAFDQCKKTVGRTILSSGAMLINTKIIVSSPLLVITKICTTDGSVLVTCSAPDSKMITTQSPDC